MPTSITARAPFRPRRVRCAGVWRGLTVGSIGSPPRSPTIPRTVSGADVKDLDRLIRRLEATKLALIAKADRQEVRRRSGAASTSAWATLTNASGGGASCDVAPATALDENLPATKAAFGAGEVSRTNAGIIADTMAKLPDTISDPERVKVEQAMVRDAKRLPPGRLRKAGLVAIGAAERSAAEVAQHQEDQLVDQERRAYAASHLSMFDRPDGTTKGEFVVPTGAAHVLRKVVQSMTSPRRNHLNSTAEATLADGQQPAGDLADGSVAAGLFAATAEQGPSRNTEQGRAAIPTGTHWTGGRSADEPSSSCSSTCPPTSSPARSPDGRRVNDG